VPSWQVTVTDGAMTRTFAPPITLERPVGQGPQDRRVAAAVEPDQELRLRAGDCGQEVPGVETMAKISGADH
jgi:hypothetical protein